VLFDEELEGANKMVSAAKDLFIKANYGSECAFVALTDSTKLQKNGKPLTKDQILDEAESLGYSLLMAKPLAVEELGRLVKEFVLN